MVQYQEEKERMETEIQEPPVQDFPKGMNRPKDNRINNIQEKENEDDIDQPCPEPDGPVCEVKGSGMFQSRTLLFCHGRGNDCRCGTGSGNWVVPGNSAVIMPDLYAPEGNEPLRIRLHFCPGCLSLGNNPFYEKMQYLKNQADSRGSKP